LDGDVDDDDDDGLLIAGMLRNLTSRRDKILSKLSVSFKSTRFFPTLACKMNMEG
jgi:hypothetical protein